MPCGVLSVRERVAPDRLPPNNLARNRGLAVGRILDRATSHTSTKIGASACVENFATPDPACFCGSPAPRSQGCEVARVLPALDTVIEDKFPILGIWKSRPGCKDFPKKTSCGVPKILTCLILFGLGSVRFSQSFGKASAHNQYRWAFDRAARGAET